MRIYPYNTVLYLNFKNVIDFQILLVNLIKCPCNCTVKTMYCQPEYYRRKAAAAGRPTIQSQLSDAKNQPIHRYIYLVK
jgi:hypothetical protein